MTTVEENPLAESDVAEGSTARPFPSPPTFDSVEAERVHRKKALVDALNIIGNLGFAEGVAGHITVRDPEHLDRFWVNPFGVSFRHVQVDQLLEVDHDGTVLSGAHPLNTAAFAIHGAIHATRPDVTAACHTHAIHSKAYSSLGVPLEMISQDHCMFFNDIAMHSDDGGAIVTDPNAGLRLAESLADKKALIHQNHGVITVGETVDAAAWWFIALERACQTSLMAMAAGTPKVIPDDYAQYSYDQSGHDFGGWFQFQAIRQEHGKA